MSADISLIANCCGSHSHNVTHNLAPMFREAGVDWREYRDHEWTAQMLITDAARALENLVDHPDKFRPMSAENGWGTYEQAIPFLARLIADFARHPDAIVEVSL